jgi:hypothetical protein
MGSQGLPTLSQNAPPPLMRAAVHRAMTPGGVVHYGVLANQRANDRCSCVRYGECEPSII